MAQTDYTVEGRQFRTKNDYARALHDKRIMDRLRQETNLEDRQQLEKLKSELQSGKYKFFTLLGQDFVEEVEGYIQDITGRKGKKLDDEARKVLKKQDLRRKLIIAACSLVVVVCIGCLGFFSYQDNK